jgi:hypothetical protein
VQRSRLAIALGLVVPALVLGGCSGEPEPRFAPAESSSPAVRESPSSTASAEQSAGNAPRMPAAAERRSPGGAEAFVEFYWETVDYAQSTGKFGGLKALGTASCVACRSGVAGLTKIFEEGGKIKGGETSLSRLSSSRISSGNHEAVQVKADIANTRQVIVYPGPRKDQVFPAGTVSAQFVVDPTPDGWKMAYWAGSS